MVINSIICRANLAYKPGDRITDPDIVLQERYQLNQTDNSMARVLITLVRHTHTQLQIYCIHSIFNLYIFIWRSLYNVMVCLDSSICLAVVHNLVIPYNAEILLFQPWRPTGFCAGIDFSRQNLTSVDVRFWRLKSILFQPWRPTGFCAGIDFSRQNLTSVDVRFWRLKSILF